MVEGRKAPVSSTVKIKKKEVFSTSQAEQATESRTWPDLSIVEVGEPCHEEVAKASSRTMEITEHDFDIELSSSTVQHVDEPQVFEDDDSDPASTEAFRGRQERRSRLKIARLTGMDSFSSLESLQSVSSATHAEHPSSIESDKKLACTRAKSARTRRNPSGPAEDYEDDDPTGSILDLILPQLNDGGPIMLNRTLSNRAGPVDPRASGVVLASEEDEWKSWSTSSSSSSSPSLTPRDLMSEVDSRHVETMAGRESLNVFDSGCFVSHYGLAPDEDITAVNDGGSLCEERDLIELLRLRNAFMRGDI